MRGARMMRARVDVPAQYWAAMVLSGHVYVLDTAVEVESRSFKSGNTADTYGEDVTRADVSMG